MNLGVAYPIFNQKVFSRAHPSITNPASADVQMPLAFRIADHAQSVPACQPKPSEHCTRYVMYLRSDVELLQCFFSPVVTSVRVNFH